MYIITVRIFMRLFLVTLLVGMFFSDASAHDNDKSFTQRGIDTLHFVSEQFLPCALIGYAFNEYPKQTLVFVAGLLTYALYTNSRVRSLLCKYNILEEEDDEEIEENHSNQKKKKVAVTLEDDLFVY